MITIILSQAREKMLAKSPNMTQDQVDQAMTYVERFTGPVSSTIGALFFLTLVSVVLALILAIFIKKEDKSLTIF